MPTERVRLLVAEDEKLALRLVRRYAAACPGIEVAQECADTASLAAALLGPDVDAALLDIRMPGRSVFDVLADAAAVRPLPPLVFATAYDRYALRAFEVHAVDYLLKPFTEARFRTAMNRLRQRLNTRTAPPQDVRTLLSDLGPRPERLLVPQGKRMIPLAMGAITWIRAEGDYARIHSKDGSYLVYRTLTELEGRLDPAQFLRVHRSTIVRLDAIVEVQPADNSRYRVTLADGTTLIVSRSGAAGLRKLIL
jgi:two-component system, LytTR family, response regulator